MTGWILDSLGGGVTITVTSRSCAVPMTAPQRKRRVASPNGDAATWFRSTGQDERIRSAARQPIAMAGAAVLPET